MIVPVFQQDDHLYDRIYPFMNQGDAMSDQPPKVTAFLHKTEIGLGAWQWGDRFVWHYGRSHTLEDSEAAFQASLSAGVNLIDTAEIYGNGSSEHLTGQFIQKTDKPVLVATKFFPFPWRIRKQSLLRALKNSLERLGLDKVDLYQIHWPPVMASIEHWADALAQAVQSGLTRTVGVSNFDKSQMQRVYSVLSQYDIPLASNQVQYHLLDRRVEKSGLLARCHELGIRVIAWSPLAKGVLTGKFTHRNPPPFARAREYGWVLDKIDPLINLMREIGQEHQQKTPAQVALNWIICKGALPIPGAKNASQAEQNAAAAGWRLTSEQVTALDDASDKITGTLKISSSG